MCCLPIRLLKVIVFLGAMSSIAISVALLALTIYVQVDKKDILASASQGLVKGSLVSLYVSSLLFLLLGLAGMMGSIKQSKRKQGKGSCLLAVFSIGISIFFLIFLGAVIFFFIGPTTIFGQDCTTGSKTAFIDSIYTNSQKVYQQFCYSCGCAVANGTDLYQELSSKKLNTSGTHVSYSDCPGATAEADYVAVLSALEKLLGCGGWCPLNNTAEGDPIGHYFYRFSNINDCNSQACYSSLTSCFGAFSDFLSGKGKLIGTACLIATIICFINVFAVCCICFHPSKSKKRNFYYRMIELD